MVDASRYVWVVVANNVCVWFCVSVCVCVCVCVCVVRYIVLDY